MEENIFADRQTDRIEWIDSVKGLAILLVMWGHVIEGTNPVFNWVCTFHVPVFLILSGVLFTHLKRTYNSYRHTLDKILWPYIIFSVFACITDATLTLAETGKGLLAIKAILVDGYKTVILYGIHALWYLGSYMIAVGVFFRINDTRRRYTQAVSFITFVLLGAGFSIVSKRFQIPTIISLPIASIIRSLVCAAFLIAGSKLHNIIVLLSSRRNLSLMLGIILLAISLIFAEFNGESNYSTVDYGNNPLFFILASFCGAIGLCLSFLKLRIHFLDYFGKNSLILLITHSSLKLKAVFAQGG